MDAKAVRKNVLEDAGRVESLSLLSCFRNDFYDCLNAGVRRRESRQTGTSPIRPGCAMS
jgi:hypothetical protein